MQEGFRMEIVRCEIDRLTRRVERGTNETTNCTGYQVVEQLSLLALFVRIHPIPPMNNAMPMCHPRPSGWEAVSLTSALGRTCFMAKIAPKYPPFHHQCLQNVDSIPEYKLV